MRTILLAAAALALAACHAEDPDRYDLVCTGKTTTLTEKGRKTVAPWSAHYIIDLKTKKWCDPKDCTVLTDLDVSPDTLTFTEVTTGEVFDVSGQTTNYVRRTTGEYTGETVPITANYPDEGIHTAGQCSKARFSDFPTKF